MHKTDSRLFFHHQKKMSVQSMVLCPDGHRVTIKSFKHTPLLTILEEACAKRNLDPSKHALRRENDRPQVPNLDTSLTFGFAGLPNHCKLEIVEESGSAGSEGRKVKIALQLEQGGRFISEYQADDNLEAIFIKAQEKLENPVEDHLEPVIIYMRQEFVGLKSFQSTTLKKLGLTSGSAVLRLIFRAPDALNDQANVVKIKEKEQKTENQDSSWRPMRREGEESNLKLFETAKKSVKNEETSNEEQKALDLSMETEKVEEKPMKTEDFQESPEIAEVTETEIEIEEPAEMHILDENRGTVVYKLTSGNSGNQLRKIQDVSDDFFELTIEDAKKILRDTRKLQKDLNAEDKILMTAEMRKTQQEGHKLALLNKYKKCVIRLQLPDRHVIQAVYSPGTQLNQVVKEIKKYINFNQNHEELELFTTPPKTVLNINDNLLDCGLVPAALVYISAKKSSLTIANNVQLSNASGAQQALVQAGVLTPRPSQQIDEMNEDMESSSQEVSTGDHQQASSSSSVGTKRPPVPTTNLLHGNKDKKVPRWFKPSK